MAPLFYRNERFHRLLRNPKDFADALRPIYGNASASQFSELLTSHLTIAAQRVKAAAGNNTAAAQYEKQWYANADEKPQALRKTEPAALLCGKVKSIQVLEEFWRILLNLS